MSDPTPAVLHSFQMGSWRAEWHGDVLRRLQYEGVDVVHGVYFTVRDGRWETIPADQLTVQPGTHDAIHIFARYKLEEAVIQVDFTCTASSNGFRMEASALCSNAMELNRLGLCVLFDQQLAGRPLGVRRGGQWTRARFPERISPWPVVTDLEGIRWAPAPGLNAEIRLAGDVYEMEDQRNWTDPSFKCYPRPLRLPRPFRVNAGERRRSSVEVMVTSAPFWHPPSSRRPVMATIGLAARARDGLLPSLGSWVTSPDRHDGWLAQGLRDLGLTHLHYELDSESPDAEQQWQALIGLAQRVNLPVTLMVAGREYGAFLDRITDWEHLLHLVVLPDGLLSTREALVRVQEAVSAHGASAVVGVGTRGHYAQLNRLPRKTIDATGLLVFGMAAQVHAQDLLSVRDSLYGQHAIVRDLARRRPGRAIAVHTVSYVPRFNADFPISADNPVRSRAAIQNHTAWSAAWLVGSLAALSLPAVTALTYFEVTGPCGLLTNTGALTPEGEVLASFRAFAGGTVRPLTGLTENLVGLAVEKGGRQRVWLGNLGDTPKLCRVKVPAGRHIRVSNGLAGGSLDWVLNGDVVEGLVPATGGIAVIETHHGA